MRYVAVVWVVLFALTAQAETRDHPYAAKLQLVNNGAAWNGSGVLVWKDNVSGVVLTNRHVTAHGGDVTVWLRGTRTQRYPAEVIHDDASLDLAALEIAVPNVNPVVLSPWRPGLDSPITAIGYGGTKGYLVNSGVTVGFDAQKPWVFEADMPIRRGDSGGPLLDERNRLIGIRFSANANWTHTKGISRRYVRSFLDEALQNLRRQDTPPMLAQRPAPELGQVATTAAQLSPVTGAAARTLPAPPLALESGWRP